MEWKREKSWRKRRRRRKKPADAKMTLAEVATEAEERRRNVTTEEGIRAGRLYYRARRRDRHKKPQ